MRATRVTALPNYSLNHRFRPSAPPGPARDPAGDADGRPTRGSRACLLDLEGARRPIQVGAAKAVLDSEESDTSVVSATTTTPAASSWAVGFPVKIHRIRPK